MRNPISVRRTNAKLEEGRDTVRDRHISLPWQFFVLALGTLVLSLGSCHHGTGPVSSVAWGDSLVFDIGFPVSDHRSGVCQSFDLGDSSEYLYFADVLTNKKIAIFSSQGKLLHTVPLNAAIDSLGKITGVAILHPDTIVLCGAHTNKVAIIDQSGRCRQVIHLTEALHRPDGLAYELWPSFFSPFVLGDRACLHISLLANSIGSYRGKGAPYGDDLYRYTWLDRNGPHFVSFDLNSIADNLHLDWGPTEPHKDTLNDIAFVQRLGSFACINGHWFEFTINSPVIRILDPVRMTPVREFQVSSAIGPVYREPFMIPKDGLEAFQDSVDDRQHSGGFIETIHFDQRLHRYLVVLRHRRVKAVIDGKEKWKGGYTLQQYDADFNFIKETAFTDGKYRMPMMLCLAGGTYVMRAENKREGMRGIHVFDRILLDGK